MNTNAVLKFGGSSLGTAESIQNAGDRVENAQLEGPTAVVVSAARPPNTEGTTNRLIRLFETAKSGQQTGEQLDGLMQMHHQLLVDLGLPIEPLDDRAAALRNDLSDVKVQPNGQELTTGNAILKDRAQTWGEKTMFEIFQQYLEQRGISSVAVNAENLIRTNDNYGNATVDHRTSYRQIQNQLVPHLEKGRVPVIPGFFGKSTQNKTVAFSRGGSDLTGAIITAGLQADHLDICTDKDGVLQVDPERIPDTKYIDNLSYWEMLVFARRGASIVHKNSIDPIMGNGAPGIPMRIVNTENGNTRTTISETSFPGPKAIGAKDAQTFVTIRDSRMEDIGILHNVTKLFAQNGLSIDVLSSETATIELTVDGKIPEEVLRQLESQFRSCTIETNSCTVVLVGNMVKKNRGAVHALVDTSEQYRHTLTEGPDSMTVVIPQREADELIRTLYERVFK